MLPAGIENWVSSVTIVTCQVMDGQVSIPVGEAILLFYVLFRQTLGPNQPLSGGEVELAYACYSFQYTPS